MLHKYQTEPLRPALILLAVVAVIVILLPASVRPLGALFLTGPIVWILLQSLRQNRGIKVEAGKITIFRCLTRRTTSVPLAAVRGWQINGRDQLFLVWHEERTQTDPDDERPPRVRILLSAALSDPDTLAPLLPLPHVFAPEQMRLLRRVWRVRQTIQWLVILFIGLPLLIFTLVRLWTAFSATRML